MPGVGRVSETGLRSLVTSSPLPSSLPSPSSSSVKKPEESPSSSGPSGTSTGGVIFAGTSFFSGAEDINDGRGAGLAAPFARKSGGKGASEDRNDGRGAALAAPLAVKSGGRGSSTKDETEDSPVPKVVLLVVSGGKGASGILLSTGVSNTGSCLIFGEEGVGVLVKGFTAGGVVVVGVFGPGTSDFAPKVAKLNPPGLLPKLKPAFTGLVAAGPDEVDGRPKRPPDAVLDDGKKLFVFGAAGVEDGVVDSIFSGCFGLATSSASISVSLDTGVTTDGDFDVSLSILPNPPPKNEFFDVWEGVSSSSFAFGSALKVDPRTKPPLPSPLERAVFGAGVPKIPPEVGGFPNGLDVACVPDPKADVVAGVKKEFAAGLLSDPNTLGVVLDAVNGLTAGFDPNSEFPGLGDAAAAAKPPLLANAANPEDVGELLFAVDAPKGDAGLFNPPD